MFTIADIRTIAIQIERNGEAAYRRAAEAATDEEMRGIFAWMADEERRHAEWFEAIAVDRQLSEEERALEEMGRRLLTEMVAEQTFSLDRRELGQTEDFGRMLSQSKGFEQDTIMFYEFLLGLIDAADTRRQLETIIAEERRHFEQLAELEGDGDSLRTDVQR